MNLLLNSGTNIQFESPVITVLFWIVVALAVLLGIAYIYALITKIIIMATYNKYNKIANSMGYTAEETANYFLKACGVDGVKVKQTRWWSAMGVGFYNGNSYNALRKTIFLRKNIIDKNSLTSVAVATQKVGLALQDSDKNKTFTFVKKLSPIMIFGPFALLPLAILGVILDLTCFANYTGVLTIIMSAVGLLYMLASFVVMVCRIPIESRANKEAIGIMEQTNFLTPEEREDCKKIYKAYMQGYIAEFIIACVYVLYLILKVLLKVLIAVKKK